MFTRLCDMSCKFVHKVHKVKTSTHLPGSLVFIEKANSERKVIINPLTEKTSHFFTT